MSGRRDLALEHLGTSFDKLRPSAIENMAYSPKPFNQITEGDPRGHWSSSSVRS